MRDVLLVSLGGTAGLREADAELAGSLRRAGASVEVAAARPVREWRTMAALELAWARSARRAALSAGPARAVIYSSSTAALLAPAPGAIRFDAPAAGNRPGRHGLWQRPAERRRFREARLLVPWSEGGLAEAPQPHADAVVVPVPVESSGPAAHRDIAAITYGANPEKKGLDRVLAAWAAARRDGEELVVAGLDERYPVRSPARRRPPTGGTRRPSTESTGRPPGGGCRRSRAPSGVRFAGTLPREEYRALLRRSRVFVTAPRREDYGIAQLEALAEGCALVTTASPGPYAALPIARALDPRLVTGDLATAIRAALDEPAPGYADHAAEALRPYAHTEVDRVVADVLLPRLLDSAR
ncbi:MAG TPA: glycosyltransferase [Solirubrobacteraceae bacterium]|nr:glycosyltransferase [Solirubrobacteraceae bacterium]